MVTTHIPGGNMKAILFGLFLIVGCASAQPIETAQEVDVERYIGRWYAITSLPQFFTRNCDAQMADYEIINAQTISVLNTCLKSGKQKDTTIKGQAVVTNAATNAELEVTFNNFFTRLFRVKGDYNILKLDPAYRYVLVGSRNRKSLWILAREKKIPEAVIEEYTLEAKRQGFPVEKLEPSKF
jgi:apolipoprotein D and lipocalin family protein